MYVYNIESKNGYLRCIPQIRTKIVRIVDILGLRFKKKKKRILGILTIFWEIRKIRNTKIPRLRCAKWGFWPLLLQIGYIVIFILKTPLFKVQIWVLGPQQYKHPPPLKKVRFSLKTPQKIRNKSFFNVNALISISSDLSPVNLKVALNGQIIR